jgi:hypothetical protein
MPPAGSLGALQGLTTGAFNDYEKGQPRPIKQCADASGGGEMVSHDA